MVVVRRSLDLTNMLTVAEGRRKDSTLVELGKRRG